ncbi:MAG: methyltransferase [Candidatus Coatesbacteria bacterium RBG_13_66_14]|uniref:Methyltransferase n=1 Tax=Candidatus Coatesbacteria bacterium RBG_13_66_14 TaxID=1817816 RepID=A0A1F5FER2_9BACT|nr:MAG: methyltransferase [Candidatus Coatesbacteria bacterium RBG_13_66_14]
MDVNEVGRFWDENAPVWTRLARMGCDVCRDQFNTPGFLAMLPDVAGLSGLDLGCGEGANTRHLARRGARMTALDVSPTFVRLAADFDEGETTRIAYLVADGCLLPFAPKSFDFVTAFMSLMDMPGQERAFAEARRVLKPGGFLQFSITHPCTDTPYRKWIEDGDGRHIALSVADYFRENFGEICEWMFCHAPAELRETLPKFRIPDFHRTLSFYLNALADTGFVLERVCEPTAPDEAVERFPLLADSRIIPMFLIIRARLSR